MFPAPIPFVRPTGIRPDRGHDHLVHCRERIVIQTYSTQSGDVLPPPPPSIFGRLGSRCTYETHGRNTGIWYSARALTPRGKGNCSAQGIQLTNRNDEQLSIALKKETTMLVAWQFVTNKTLASTVAGMMEVGASALIGKGSYDFGESQVKTKMTFNRPMELYSMNQPHGFYRTS